jgi:hypothetical protein
MARHIQHKNEQITIVGVGGAWHQLKNRRCPRRDFYYFGATLTHHQKEMLKHAAVWATNRPGVVRMQQGWFEDRNVSFVSQEAHKTANLRAVTNDEVLFEEEGLKVICASPEYAFVAKLDAVYDTYFRLKMPAPIIDKDDVIFYLRIAMAKRKQTTVSFRELLSWAEDFGISEKDPQNPSLNPLEPLLDEIITHRGAESQITVTKTPRGERQVNRLGHMPLLDFYDNKSD